MTDKAAHREAVRNAIAAVMELDDEEFAREADELLVLRAMDAMSSVSEYIGKCEGCGAILLEGDKGHRCHDGEPVFCVACAFTWGDVYDQHVAGEHSADAEERGCFMRRYEAHIAGGGSRDDKMVWEL